MNTLYLKPWKARRKARLLHKGDFNNRWYRYSLDGSFIVAVILPNLGGAYDWVINFPLGSPTWTHSFETPRVAMEKCDIELVKRNYVLLTDEQVEKLTILL